MAKPLKIARLPEPMKALHAFLKEHWGARHLPGAGTFNARLAPVLDISSFSAVMALLVEAVDAQAWERADEIVTIMPVFDEFLSGPRYAGHAAHLGNLRNAIARRSADRARIHLHRLAKVVRRVAADRVYKGGEQVRITRDEHGWYDGRVGGSVREGSGGHVVDGDDGMVYEIRHLRDIR